MRNPTSPPLARPAAASRGKVRRGAARGPVAVLDRQSPLPLYAQVVRRLKAMISAHEHPPERFYSEAELCSMFGVSRATVRQAVQELAAGGWLRSERGHGTFVNRDRFDESFSPLMNFLDQWAQVGRPLHLALRRFEMAPCPAEFAGWLGVAPDMPVLCLERIRGDGPDTISYDYRYIHPDCASSIDRAAAETTSLLHLLNRGLRLLRGENKVEAALAGPAHAGLLGVAPEAPVLIREMAYFADDGLPVMVGRSLYRADKIRCAFNVGLVADPAAPAATAQPAGTAQPAVRHPGGIAEVGSVGGWPDIGPRQ
ncbi:MAG: GntR family transcriptional regulator [Lautropia sp.]